MTQSKPFLALPGLLLLAITVGCMEGPANGKPIAGAPDGAVERLVVSDSGVVKHAESRFLAEVNRKDQTLVVVDFWATWCGPCQALGPELEDLKKSWGDKIEVVKVDVDNNSDIASHLGISGIPDVRIFRNGTQVGGFVGAIPKAEIDSILKSLQ